MLVKTITYEDYNGETRTENFYFNLTKTECLELETSVNGGISEYIRRITAAQDGPSIMAIFKKVILMAYGEKSPDGKYFDKSEEISRRFEHCPAYDELIMEIVAGGADTASAFINAILPKDATATDEEKNDKIAQLITEKIEENKNN